jgi:hypothetical protein
MQQNVTRFYAIATLFFLLGHGQGASAADTAQRCESLVKADVVALDQAFQVNRLGTTRTDGEIFALRADVVSTDANNRGCCV